MTTFDDNTDAPETDVAADAPIDEAPDTEAADVTDTELAPAEPEAPEAETDEPAAEAEADASEAPPAIDPETGEILAPAAEAAPAATADEPVVIDAEDLLVAPVDNPADRPGKWFVVHTQSGYEKKVKQNLEARTSSMNMEGRIHEVVIPMEDVIEFKNGKKVVVQKKMFPGYLLVRCHLDDDSWYVIRNTPGVTGFVGQGTKPSPLRRKEVETFLSIKVEGDELQPGGSKARPRLEWEISETVRVKEGPFADFSGQIVEINEDQLKVKVLVNIFGRETPVELDFSQIAKL